MAYADAVNADSPLIYWRFEETSGTTVADSTWWGSGHAGTIGGVTWDLDVPAFLPGTPGESAIAFTNAHCRRSGVSDLPKANAGEISIELWVQWTDEGWSQLAHLVAGGTAATMALEIRTGLDADLNADPGRILAAHNGIANRIVAPGAYNDGQPHHVVAVLEGTSLELWIDGELQASGTVPRSTNTSNTWFKVGAGGSTGGATANPFVGLIDEAALYDVALSGEQIQAHHQAGAGASNQGAAELALKQSVARAISRAVQRLAQRITAEGLAELGLAQSVAWPLGTAALPLRQAAIAAGMAELPLMQIRFHPPDLLAPSIVWRPAVTVNGVDLTHRLTGAIRIEAEEGAARIAELTLAPGDGPVAPADWVGAGVRIEFVLAASGQRWPRFIGRVHEARFIASSGLLELQATDGLQDRLDATPRPLIDAQVGGHWSPAVFRDDASGWEYAQDRLSTVPASYDLLVSGSGRLTSWLPKATPDHLFGAAVYGSVGVSLTPARDLVNEVEIALDYRYERLYQRERRVGWIYPRSFCEYLILPTTLPDQAMIRSALEGTGWLLQSLAFTGLPPSGHITSCGGTVVWTNDRPELVTAFSAQLARRWTQTVTERLRLRLVAPQSVGRYGHRNAEESRSLSSAFDPAEWEGQAANNHLAVRGDQAAAGFSLGTPAWPPPAGAALNAHGDWQLDRDEPAALEEAVAVLLARARTRILAAHRRNTVECLLPWFPVERTDTVRLETPQVLAQGKVAHVLEVLDLASGRATTTVRLAISQGGVPAAVKDSPLALPGRADTAPMPPPSGPALNTPRHSQFGGLIDSPEYDDTLAGYSGNYQLIPAGTLLRPWEQMDASAVEPGAPAYPVRFRIDMPGVEAALRDHLEAPLAATFRVAIPNDELTLQV